MSNNVLSKFKKKIAVSSILILAVSTVYGCSSKNYTDEEEDMIADYAANIVLKHDVNYMGDYLLETTEPETTTSQQTTSTQEETVPVNNSDGQGDLSIGDALATSDQITNALDLGGLSAEYVDYLVTDSYPTENTEDALFVMKAVQGSKLLVVKFRISNNSGSDISINMMQSGRNYKGIVNGTKKFNAQVSLLLDALNTFEGTIAAGQSQEYVIVYQTQLDSKEDVNSLSMEITDSKGNTNTIKLK